MTAVAIRPYEDTDREAVRDLFIRINRELAPEALNFGLEPAENDTAIELRRMYVDPQARRLGIARIMLDPRKQSAASAGG